VLAASGASRLQCQTNDAGTYAVFEHTAEPIGGFVLRGRVAD
jgi:hypothetical protein